MDAKRAEELKAIVREIRDGARIDGYELTGNNVLRCVTGEYWKVEGVGRLRLVELQAEGSHGQAASNEPAQFAPEQHKQGILDAIHKLDEASFEHRDHFKDVIPALYEKYVGFGGEGESRSIQDRLAELGVDQLTALRDEIAEELRDYGASLLEQKAKVRKARARKDPSVLTPMQVVAVAAIQSTGPATAAQIASAMGMEGQAVKVSGVLSSAVEKGRLMTTRVKGRAVYHLVEWNPQDGAKEE